MSAQDIQQLQGLLEVYIDQSPDLLDTLWARGQQAGITKEILPFIQMAGNYFLMIQDIIPDQQGVYGLLDDAYATQHFVQSASDGYEQLTGLPLVPEDLRQRNNIIRSIIGETVAAELDTMVATAMQTTAYTQAQQQLSNWGGSLTDTGTGSWGGTWEDEMSRTAASCGISINW
jgi:uncharacterized membrane protein YkvA (DUF1232 family)